MKTLRLLKAGAATVCLLVGPAFASNTTDPLIGATPVQAAPTNSAADSPAIGNTESVINFGAYGDGIHDDTAAIQSGLNAIASDHQELFFPCGTYLVTSPLTLYAPRAEQQTGSIVGENTACAIIQYTGKIAAPVITVTTNLSGQYFSGFYMGKITVLGNANTTDDIFLVRPSNFVLDNLSMWGANSSNGDCLQLDSGIGGKVDTPVCSASITLSILPRPNIGILFKGQNDSDQTGALTVLNPVVEGATGIGTDLVSSSLIFMSGCQTSGNGKALNIDSGSFKNNIVNCLFEDSPIASYVGGYNNVLDNDTFSYFSGNSNTIDLQVDGRQNTVSNALIQWGLSILPTASLANLSNDLFGTPPTDAGQGTKISNATFSNPGMNISFPQSIDNTYTTPGFAGSGTTQAETITGSWVFSNGVIPLSPTIFPTGKSWRAIFVGQFGGAGSAAALEAMPTFLELTESSNTILMPSTATLTFAVSAGGLFSVSGGSGAETFNGTITFLLDTAAATSGANVSKLSGLLYGSFIGPLNGSVGATTPASGVFTTVTAPMISTSPFLPATGYNSPVVLTGGDQGYLYLSRATGAPGLCYGGSIAGGVDSANYGGVFIRALASFNYPCGHESYENTLGVFHDRVISLAPITAPAAAFSSLSVGGRQVCLADGTNCPISIRTASNSFSRGLATFSSPDSAEVISASIPSITNIQIVLPTEPISPNTCTMAAAATMRGLGLTSTFTTAFASDPSAATGWGATGGLNFVAWPTANTINWKVCNVTSSVIIPGAITLNVGAR
jgi:hypothetical protein